MISGVAGALAAYLDVDPALIRIAWALLAILTGGAAAVVYLVAILVIPEAPTDDRLPARPRDGSPRAETSSGRLVAGALLVLVGLAWLGGRLLPWLFAREILGPLVVIGLGAFLLFEGVRR